MKGYYKDPQGTAEALRRLGTRQHHSIARAMLRDARWGSAEAGPVPILGAPAPLSVVGHLLRLRLRQRALLVFLTALDDPVLASANIDAILQEVTPRGFVPNFGCEHGASEDRSQPPVGAYCVLKLYRAHSLLGPSRRPCVRWHVISGPESCCERSTLEIGLMGKTTKGRASLQ